MSFLTISSSARLSALCACWISLSSLARAARPSASFFLICCSRSVSSARRSSAFFSCSWRSNSTSRSPGLTRVPARTSLMMTSEFDVRARQPRRGDGGRLDRLDRAAQPDQAHEVPPGDRGGRVPSPASLGLRLRAARRHQRRGAAKQDNGGRAGRQVAGLHARDHDLLLDTTGGRTDAPGYQTCWTTDGWSIGPKAHLCRVVASFQLPAPLGRAKALRYLTARYQPSDCPSFRLPWGWLIRVRFAGSYDRFGASHRSASSIDIPFRFA